MLQNRYGSDHFPIIIERPERLPIIPIRTPRWKLVKADWALFQIKTVLDAGVLVSLSPEDFNKYVTETILRSANSSVPQTSAKLPKGSKPWWDKECDAARKRRNCAWGIFGRYPIVINHVEFKKTNVQYTWTRKRAKCNSWKDYVSSLNSFVSTKEAWTHFIEFRATIIVLHFLLLLPPHLQWRRCWTRPIY